MIRPKLTRRTAVSLFAAGPFLASAASAAEKHPVITVYKDPTCGCCNGWVEHLEHAGFKTVVQQEEDMTTVKKRLAVPDELASCHTAEVNGYVIEGHVPAEAIKRLITKKPKAHGLAVPGMPIGSPGMGGPNPEPYDVMLFGKSGSQRYMRFIETRVIG